MNASQRLRKGKPKNYFPEEDIRPQAAAYLKAQPIDGEIAVIQREEIEKSDYNLSPNRWIGQAKELNHDSILELIKQANFLNIQSKEIWDDLEPKIIKLGTNTK